MKSRVLGAWRTLSRVWPVIWRPVLLVAVGAGGVVLFQNYPAPPESAAYAAIADELRADGAPETLFVDSVCSDEEVDYALSCDMFPIDQAVGASVKIAVGEVSNVAGYWSGSSASASVGGVLVAASSRTSTWGDELPVAIGRSDPWVLVTVPPLDQIGGSRVVDGEVSLEVRYPKSTRKQVGNVSISGFENRVTRLFREVSFFAATGVEMDQFAALSETPRLDYPLWQDVLLAGFWAGIIGGVGWVIFALIREEWRRRPGSRQRRAATPRRR